MSVFEQVLQIAQEQLAAVARGDLDAAVNRLDERGALIARFPVAEAHDTWTIEEIMQLDRVLSGAIRERMIAIRDESMETRRGARALSGYGHATQGRPTALDAVR